MNDNRNFYKRLEFERNWLKNAVSVTYWNDIDVALNAISAKHTETIEDIKAEIKAIPYQRLFGSVSCYSMLDVILEIIDKHMRGDAE